MEKQNISVSGGSYNAWSPRGAPPLLNGQREDHWRHFDNSVNAVSFGFVATAILIFMFLIMAIFERFLRPNSTSRNGPGDLESQMGFNPKLGQPSPKMTVYANGVSVLMPGDNIPTFIAHPAPIPCPPKDHSSLQQPHHHLQQQRDVNLSPDQPGNLDTNSSSISTQEIDL